MNKIVMAACFMMVVFPALADDCPSGLQYIGIAYGEDSQVNKEAKHEARNPHLVKFPPNFKLDSSYVQHGGQWAGGSARAVMNAGDVPNGLHIIASGTEGGEKGWAVHPPHLEVLSEEDGYIVQRGYNIPLYCHSGSGELSKLGHVSCNVKAIVCAKKKG